MTKRCIAYLLYLIIIFYMAMVYLNYGLYLVLYLSLAVPVLALLYLLVLRKKVVFAFARTEMAVQRGEETGISLAVRNNSFLPTGNTYYRYSVTDVLLGKAECKEGTIVIPGRSVNMETITATLSHSGIVTVSVDAVKVREPLGLFCCTISSAIQPIQYIVMPVLSDLQASPWLHNPYAYIGEEEFSKIRPGDDPSELFGTREYRPGDKQNRIHWNLTAKADEMIVKEYSLPVDHSTLVVLDLFPSDDESLVNGLFDVAFSVSQSLISEQHPHVFTWLDTETGTVNEEKIVEEDSIYPLISKVFHTSRFTEKESVVPKYFALHEKDRYKNIFYISTCLKKEVTDVLRTARRDAFVTCYFIDREGQDVKEGEWCEFAIRPEYVTEDLGRKRGDL